MFKSISLRTKLISLFILVGILPALGIAIATIVISKSSAKDISKRFQATAENVQETINAAMFERYGDAQVFAANKINQQFSLWFKRKSAIVDSMNEAMNIYDCYGLMMLVDTRGNLVAVNDHDYDGKPIATEYLYQLNFAEKSWFKDSMSGRFTMDTEGNTGTVVEDLYISEHINKIYGSEGLVVTFSAPVKDSWGNIIAISHNLYRFNNIEKMVVKAYKKLQSQGFPSSEILVLNKKGGMIVHYDPSHEKSEKYKRDLTKILKWNLLESKAAGVA